MIATPATSRQRIGFNRSHSKPRKKLAHTIFPAIIVLLLFCWLVVCLYIFELPLPSRPSRSLLPEVLKHRSVVAPRKKAVKDGLTQEIKQIRNELVVKESNPPFVTICQTNKEKRPNKRMTSHKYMVTAESLKHDREKDTAESFNNIYTNGIWGGGEVINGTKLGGSGPGSLMSSTVEVRKTLDAIIETVKAKLGKDHIKMLDLPCGDLVWMKHYLNSRSDIDYTGMDIVGPLITQHTKMFSRNNLPWQFKQHDIVKDPLSEKYDLIFSRQMTQHLGTEDTMLVLQHFSDGAEFLLVSNYLNVKRNIPLNTNTPYRFRPQNLNELPFALTDPICEDEEQGCVNALFKLPLQQWN